MVSTAALLAQACVTLLRVVLVGSLAAADPRCVSWSSPAGFGFFWAVTAATVLYFKIGLTDPGFLKTCPTKFLEDASERVPSSRRKKVIDFAAENSDEAIFSSSDGDSFFSSDSDTDNDGSDPGGEGAELIELARQPSDVKAGPGPGGSPAVLGKAANGAPNDDEACSRWASVYRAHFTRRGSQVFQQGLPLEFCKKCCLYQPLRAKHCKYCAKCVRTHDHHCPWFGVCIGERTRCAFLWYLVFETVELAAGCAIALTRVLDGSEAAKNATSFSPPSLRKHPMAAELSGILIKMAMLVVSGTVMLALLIMVVCLLIYHIWLASSNLTTWEDLAWTRVTYIRNTRGRSSDRKSPFSRGTVHNLLMYCCGTPRTLQASHWCCMRASRIGRALLGRCNDADCQCVPPLLSFGEEHEIVWTTAPSTDVDTTV
eukprot:Polyplicarium_translucidae@DN2186_c0_g1_i4.p1